MRNTPAFCAVPPLAALCLCVAALGCVRQTLRPSPSPPPPCGALSPPPATAPAAPPEARLATELEAVQRAVDAYKHDVGHPPATVAELAASDGPEGYKGPYLAPMPAPAEGGKYTVDKDTGLVSWTPPAGWSGRTQSGP
jgi:hypothetical protein